MEAREGVLFLRQLLQSPEYAMTPADLEEAAAQLWAGARQQS